MHYKHHLSPEPLLFVLHSLRRYISLGTIISTTTCYTLQAIPNTSQKKAWSCCVYFIFKAELEAKRGELHYRKKSECFHIMERSQQIRFPYDNSHYFTIYYQSQIVSLATSCQQCNVNEVMVKLGMEDFTS